MFKIGDKVNHKAFKKNICEVVDGTPLDSDCFVGKLIKQQFNLKTLGIIYNNYLIERFELNLENENS